MLKCQILIFTLPPSTQLAFILNLQQHWFTLRRFGVAFPNIDDDPGDGHWFNLNSSLPSPEWVSKLYLGMVLQQAEADGIIHLLSRPSPLLISLQGILYSQSLK